MPPKVPRTIEWIDGRVKFINQLKLPWELEVVETSDPYRLVKAIKDMEIRGAPAIGAAAAFTLALAAVNTSGSRETLLNNILKAKNAVEQTRPTAVNLFNATNRVWSAIKDLSSPDEIREKAVEEAIKIAEEDVIKNKLIGEHGEKLLKDGDTVLTICNAGSLATVYYGTALAPIYVAWDKGKRVNVIALETRPYLQGARLTAYELSATGIPVRVATDNSIGILMLKEKIDIVFVGADRVTRDGYVANKIGTYPTALLAKRHGKPFYVCAPTTTIDFKIKPEEIVIEKRSSEEVTKIFGREITPKGVKAIYYAFDITPPELITGIITEKGIFKPPLPENLANT